MTELHLVAPEGVGEVGPGDDLAEALTALVELHDGDVVLVTSKVVSKAEGRVVPGTRDDALAGETARVVARRGATRIVRTHHGLTLAAAGIDASNVEPGRVVLLPVDPDASARRLRDRLAQLTGRNVGVVVTDTAGRAWRTGQTDLAVGAAGVHVLDDHAGRRDGYGNDLAVTAPAVADELAAAAELVQGKLGRRPFAVVRGRPDLVLPPGDHGPGAAALIRPEDADMFGLGSREAVVRALAGDPSTRVGFGAVAASDEVAEAVVAVTGVPPQAAGSGLLAEGAWEALCVLAFAHGWHAVRADPPATARLLPGTP
ncbi:coenzyme F420-0:L-glutamate ligase [Nocardioides coralli]|uniref:coenzyme F420-0:L-glutamate ligase n=1 Tax=Nocardioides coralli TaxID=2872154 RepID=UPI001CA440F1|nr:coenzyme F420-0:L-glutamate ligase [Nocardioides coralli]QZY30015.1 coenzyme F420-0:L-glutamate ligase [Nocardioides coralli]